MQTIVFFSNDGIQVLQGTMTGGRLIIEHFKTLPVEAGSLINGVITNEDAIRQTLSEAMAEEFCRWDPSFKIFGLRFSNIMAPERYAEFPAFDADPKLRRWNLWAYIDARDAAQAVRLALESPLKGAEVFIISS